MRCLSTTHWIFPVLVWLGVGLAALAVGLAYQVRSMVADAPRVRAMETLAIGLPFLLLLYALGLHDSGGERARQLTQVLDRTDALYFTMTVFTTVARGYRACDASRTRHDDDADGHRPRRGRPRGTAPLRRSANGRQPSRARGEHCPLGHEEAHDR